MRTCIQPMILRSASVRYATPRISGTAMTTILTERPDDGPRRPEQRRNGRGQRLHRIHATTRSTVIGPVRPSRPQVDGCAAAILTTPAGTRGVDARSSAPPRRAPCRDLDLRAFRDADLGQRQRAHPRPRWFRVGGLLQRRRPARERVREMDRNVGHALESRSDRVAGLRRSRPVSVVARAFSAMSAARRAATSRTSSIVSKSKPGSSEQRAQDAQHFPGGTRLAERLHDAVEELAGRPSQLTNVPAVSV